MKTEHPCKGMTRAQIAWFERITTGTHGSLCPKKTMDKLLERGVVVYLGEKVSCFGGRFPVTIKDYDVPIHVHMQFCKWADEQPEPRA